MSAEDDKDLRTKWDDLKMRDQIGIFCDVERDKKGGDAIKRANRALNDIGDFIHEEVPQVKELEYLGSAAVHIFLARGMQQVVYISQTQPLGETPERVAGPAFTDLQKSMMDYYGRKTTKIRSGF
jgi:hypothetical protein